MLEESTLATDTAVYVDTQTGVNYLMITAGFVSGLPPLLGPDEKTIVSPLQEE